MTDWYPWYIELYEADAGHLSCLEHGAYRQLIDRYMRTRSPLPDDDAALARFVGLSMEEWRVIAPTIRNFFRPGASKLHHKRCNLILAEQDKRFKKRSDASRHAAQARWMKDKENNASGMPAASDSHAEGNADGMPMPSECDANAMRKNAIRQDKTEVRESTATTSHTSQTSLLRKRDALFFELKTIRLNQADYELWKKTYHAIPDFNAELQRIDDSLVSEAERKSWFVSTSAKLNFAHKKYLAEAKAAPARQNRGNGYAGPPPRKWSVSERMAKVREWNMELAPSGKIRERVYAEGLADVWTFGDG